MTLWSWGANSYGQLAHGHTDDVLVPRKVEHVPTNIRSIACGGGHTLYLTEARQLWVCGSNNKGQLGIGTMEDVMTLTLVTSFKVTVAMVSGGWDFSLAVTDTGEVYSWGSNAFGQLGDPSLPSKCTVPSHVSVPGKVMQVAAGLRHAVALTDSGDVFCWGHAKKGQCGGTHDGKIVQKYTSPVKVAIPDDVGKIIQVVAGSYHTAGLSESGCVVIWGCNKHGQTTLDPSNSPQLHLPSMVDLDLFEGRKVKVIRSGWTHLLAQTETGNVYSWGRCDYGQLGRSRSPGQGHCHIPAPVETAEKIIDLQCGSEHCLFITGKQKLLSVGWNEHGLCGTGDEVNVDIVTPVLTLSDTIVTHVACGGGHCFAVTQDTVDNG